MSYAAKPQPNCAKELRSATISVIAANPKFEAGNVQYHGSGISGAWITRMLSGE
jgi:hypothetical protein